MRGGLVAAYELGYMKDREPLAASKLSALRLCLLHKGWGRRHGAGCSASALRQHEESKVVLRCTALWRKYLN